MAVGDTYDLNADGGYKLDQGRQRVVQTQPVQQTAPPKGQTQRQAAPKTPARPSTGSSERLFSAKHIPRAQEIARFWIEAGGDPKLIPTMVGIAFAESTGDYRAHNPNRKTQDDSYGLYQINLLGRLRGRIKEFGLKSAEDLFDPLTNSKAAVRILGQQGLTAWTTWDKGRHKPWMPTWEELGLDPKTGRPPAKPKPTAAPAPTPEPSFMQNVQQRAAGMWGTVKDALGLPPQ